MPNQDIYTMTPGSAVADKLQEILTSRRLEARQAMLDQLNTRNVESQMEERKASMDSLAEQRAATAEWRKAQAQGVTDKQGEVQRRRQGISAFMASPEFSQLDPSIRQQMSLANTTGDDDLLRTIITNMGHKPGPEGGEVYTISPTGEMVDTGGWDPRGPQYHQLPNIPREPAPVREHKQDVGPELDPTGKPTGNRVVFDPNSGSYSTSPARAGAKGGQTPHDVLSSSDRNAYARARGKATDIPGSGPFNFFGGKTATPQDKAAFDQTEKNILSKFPPKFAQLVSDIRAHESPDTTNEAVVENAVTNGYIAADEAPLLAQLLTVVR